MYFINPVVMMTMDTRNGKYMTLGQCTISIDIGSRQPDIELYAAKVMPEERCVFSASGFKKAVAAYKKAETIF